MNIEMNDKAIEIAAEKMMYNHHGIMNGYSMDYCRGIVKEIFGYFQLFSETNNPKEVSDE